MIDEYKHALFIKDILNKKIHDNKDVVDEKSKAIIESIHF